jgi:peptidoglycan/LPS O-acetylase OafA/YrhL
MAHYIVMSVLPFLGLQETLWLDCTVGVGGSIATGGLAWRFVERPMGEAMRRRTLSSLGQKRAARP